MNVVRVARAHETERECERRLIQKERASEREEEGAKSGRTNE